MKQQSQTWLILLAFLIGFFVVLILTTEAIPVSAAVHAKIPVDNTPAPVIFKLVIIALIVGLFFIFFGIDRTNKQAKIPRKK